MNKINKDPEGRSSSSSGSGARTHSVVINSAHGHCSGMAKKRAVGKDARSGGITVVTPSKPSSSLFSCPASSPMPPPAASASKKGARSWYPSPPTTVEANGFDSDADFVHWQSSQTTNLALNNLLREASLEGSNSSARASSSSSRISPPWQHSPAKSSPLMVNMPASATASSSSIHKSSSSSSRASLSMAVDKHPTTDRLRSRRAACGSGSLSSLTSHPQQQSGLQRNASTSGDDSRGFSSPFTSNDPNQILEMMRGVSAMIDESISSNTPVTKTRVDKGKMKLAASTSAAVNRSWSSMDIDMEGVGNVQSPLSGFEKKGKGKEREHGWTTNGLRRQTNESSADADVSMADVSVTLDNLRPLEVPFSEMRPRRQEMLPPPPPIGKSKQTAFKPGLNPTSTSSPTRSGHSRRPAPDSTFVVASASPSGVLFQGTVVAVDGNPKVPSKSEAPEVQLHPLLLEKERLKELKRSQRHASPVPSDHVSHSPAIPNLSARAPLTRTTSIPDTLIGSRSIHSSQSPSPLPDGSQPSRQVPPRLGMRSRTAPLPPSNAQPLKSSTSLPTKNVTTSKPNQSKLLLKPFKPPSRVNSIIMSHGSQQNAGDNPMHCGFRQRGADHTYSMSSNRSAYPSPSPGSDDGGKKDKEEEEEKEIERDLRQMLTTDEPFHSTVSSKQGHRARSPPMFPPTPESVSKSGGSETEDQEEGIQIKSEVKGIQGQEEAMDGVECEDPDSSFSDMAFGISIDALEETMRKYD